MIARSESMRSPSMSKMAAWNKSGCLAIVVRAGGRRLTSASPIDLLERLVLEVDDDGGFLRHRTHAMHGKRRTALGARESRVMRRVDDELETHASVERDGFRNVERRQRDLIEVHGESKISCAASFMAVQ